MANTHDGNESRNDVRRPCRRYSAEEMRRLLDETVKPGESVSTVARRYNVAPSLLFGWRKAMDAGATGATTGHRRLELRANGLRGGTLGAA